MENVMLENVMMEDVMEISTHGYMNCAVVHLTQADDAPIVQELTQNDLSPRQFGGKTLSEAVPKKRGTKKPKKLYFKSIGATLEEWEWLGKWLPEDADKRTPTDLMAELFARAMLFWPEGADTRPVRTKPPKARLPYAAIRRYAEENGISKEEAIIKAWSVFQEQMNQEQINTPPSE